MFNSKNKKRIGNHFLNLKKINMKNLANFTLMVFTILCLTTRVSAQSYDYAPGQILIKWTSDKHLFQKSSFKNTLETNTLKTFPKRNTEVLQLDENTDIQQFIDEYQQHPDIEYIEPNYIYSTTTLPDDPLTNQLWGLHNTGQTGGVSGADIQANEAWNIVTGSPNVVVGIIDTGIDWTHEDLVDNIWQNLAEDADGDGRVLEWNGSMWQFDPGDENGIDDDGNGYVDDFVGWDFRNNDNDPFDGHGHGTHVAGTVGANGNNSKGVAGVTWDVQLAGLKFLSDSGSGYTDDAIEALDYAVNMGFRISNNSWGGGAYSDALYESLENARDNNHLFIASAGNAGKNTDNYTHYPSSYNTNNVISVAATNHNDLLSYFSNYGASSVDLAAPGSDILSCKPGNTYAAHNGTSMATPHVVGACALLWGLYPDKNFAQIKEAVLNATTSTPALTGKMVSEGRLNVYNTLNYFGTPIIGGCRNHDSLILVNLYNTTDGPNWTNTWDLNAPMDEWHGVAINESGCIDTVRLNINNMTGPLPAMLGSLTEPRGLHFGRNNLYGEIPASIGNLNTLEGLNLATNNFTGNVPPAFFNSLINLTFLALTENELTGVIPPEIANLVNMKYLYIGHNDASGPLPPEIGSLTNLIILQMDNNGFTGVLPPELENLTNLEQLQIVNNDFIGQIPAEFNDLNYFTCSGNKFTFDSFESFENANLSTFHYTPQDSIPLVVNGNILSVNAGGSIADNTYIWYKDNSEIANVTGDSTLIITESGIYRCEVSNNIFTNPLDENQNLILISQERYIEPFKNLTCRQNDSLILATLYNTTDGANWTNRWNLNAPMDDWYGVILNETGCLDTLNLNINNMTGTLPAELGNLSQPRGLHFGRNNLEGEIPAELGNLISLVGLNLATNNFTGSVPEGIYGLTNLTFLAFTENPLSGPLSPQIGNLVNMKYLYIGHTNSSGPLPPEIGNLTELIIFQMVNNGFTGALPSTVSNWTKLEYLYMQGNNFTGQIPPAWSNFSELQELYCQNNNFTFDGFEGFTIPESYYYAPQDSISITVSGNMLSVNAGGTMANNTYNWYKDGILVATNTGDNKYIYNSNGTYWCEVSNSEITTPDNTGQNLVLTSKRVQTLVNCDAQAGFMSESGAKCTGSTYTFTNTSTGSSAHTWKINGTDVSTNQDLIYTFSSYGAYNVTLIVMGNGCTDEYSQTFNVTPSASDLYFGPDISVCDNAVELIANLPDMAAYFWDLNGSIVGNTQAIMVTTPGNYVLSVLDSCGTVGIDTIQVSLGTGCVWPGDFDNNGIVDAYDLIPLGIAFGETGDERPNASLEWEPQPAPAWSGSLSDGTNYNHIDGDGNGVINLNDPAAIDANYGKVHALINANSYPESSDFSIIPEVFIQTDNEDGQIVSVNLQLENPNNKPVYSFVGSYDYSAMGNSASMDFSNSLLGVENTDFVAVQRDFGGRIEFAITLTDGNSSINIGDIGTLVVEDEYYSHGEEGPQSTAGQIILEKNIIGDANGNLVDIGEQIISLFYDEDTEVGTDFVNNNSLALVTHVNLSDCYQLADARMQVLSGTAPFTYQWSDGQIGEFATNLSVGSHEFTVTDAAGLEKTGSLEIEPGSGLWLQTIATPTSARQNDGSIAAYAYGGDGNYTYQWSNGHTTSSIQNLHAGIYFLTVTDGNGCSTIESINIGGAGVQLHLGLFLEGALKNDLQSMTTALHQQSVLPLQQPYNAATNYYEKETSDLLIFDKGHVVDWVLVELRDQNDYNKVSSTRVGLLLAGGKVADMDGSSPLFFPDVSDDSYYIYIKHRNHLPIMSATPIQVNDHVMDIDFRTTDAYMGLGAAQKQIANGVQALYAGDVNNDYDINGQDKAIWLNGNGNFGIYSNSDFNLDADINGGDKILWEKNNGYSSGTPQ